MSYRTRFSICFFADCERFTISEHDRFQNEFGMTKKRKNKIKGVMLNSFQHPFFTDRERLQNVRRTFERHKNDFNNVRRTFERHKIQ